MKERFELLAGLIEDDDLESTRDKVSESYKKQFQTDIKEVSDQVHMIEENDYIFNKFIGIMNETKDPDFVKVDESGNVARGGYGPGFGPMNTYNPFLRASIKEAQEDGPSIEAFELLNALSEKKVVGPYSEPMKELIENGLVSSNKHGFMEITEEGREYLEESNDAQDDLWPHRRMGNGGNFVSHREDFYDRGDTPTMYPKMPEAPATDGYPGPYAYYTKDQTYQKMKRKSEDPLDLDQTDDEKFRMSKFWEKYKIDDEE